MQSNTSETDNKLFKYPITICFAGSMGNILFILFTVQKYGENALCRFPKHFLFVYSIITSYNNAYKYI